MAATNLKEACSGPDGKILLRDSDNKILNEVAAAALSAFAYAASRRPSTKHVEYLMNPTQSVEAHEDTQSQSSQTLSALADPKLQREFCMQKIWRKNKKLIYLFLVTPINLPGPPYQRCSNASTGTNNSLANPFGIVNPKARKRSTHRNLRAEDEILTDDEDEEDEELEDDEVSDVGMDEESEQLSDMLDESR